MGKIVEGKAKVLSAKEPKPRIRAHREYELWRGDSGRWIFEEPFSTKAKANKEAKAVLAGGVPALIVCIDLPAIPAKKE